MSLLYILGAGASRGEHDQMPLYADFFAKAQQYFISSDRPVWDQIVGWLQQHRGATAEVLLEGKLTVEDVLTILDEEKSAAAGEAVPDWPPPIGQIAAGLNQSSIESMIRGTLLHAQWPAIQANCPRYTSLAASLTREDGVLTFNWDLLMDHALKQKRMLDERRTYGLPFDYYVPWHNTNATLVPDENRTPFTAPRYLKLHGSVNWYQCIDMNLPEGEERLTGKKVVEELPTSPTGAGVFGQDRISVRVGQRHVTLLPLVVGPVLGKRLDRRTSRGVFTQLWQEAETLLKSARVVRVIGYSFPDTDSTALARIANALQQNPTLENVEFVTPDDSVLQRAQRFLHFTSVSRLTHTFEDFVNQL